MSVFVDSFSMTDFRPESMESRCEPGIRIEFINVVVLEESPCPRGSSKTNLQVLDLVLRLKVFVLVLGPQVLVLEPQVLVLVLGPQVLDLVLGPQVLVLVLVL